jgi:DNA adenine methylase
MDALKQHLPEGELFVEPFVGGASVFLNTDYPEYILADSNPDLIQLLEVAATKPDRLLEMAKGMFADGEREDYLKYRKLFNSPDGETSEPLVRAAYFLYLNRHGYNGLCRYNASGGYNVPYGSHPSPPYLPKREVHEFAEKVSKSKVTFLCADFQQTIALAQQQNITKAVIYADPPYVPSSKTSSFTQYHKRDFGQPEHRQLAAALVAANQLGAKVVLSNSDTLLTRDIYHGFTFNKVNVGRHMAANKDKRGKVVEVIATLF